MSIVELSLIWSRSAWQREAFYLASLLAATSQLGFMAAFLSRKMYGGTLFDPNGIPPVQLKILGQVRSVDMNFVVVTIALVFVAAIDVLFRW